MSSAIPAGEEERQKSRPGLPVALEREAPRSLGTPLDEGEALPFDHASGIFWLFNSTSFGL